MDGEQARAQDYRELVGEIERMPQVIGELLADVEESSFKERPPGKPWSILEHICHLRDIEQEGYRIRIAKMIAEDRPFLNDLDGDKLAAERDYNNQDFKSALKDFVDGRVLNIRAICDLSADQLRRQGMFENVGLLTLMELLIKMRDHDRGHIAELTELRSEFCS